MRIVFKFIRILCVCLCILGIGYPQVVVNQQEGLNNSGCRTIGPETQTKWFSVDSQGDVALSPDGKYATWSIYDQMERKYTFTIGGTDGDWRQEFYNDRSGDGFFAANGAQYFYPVQRGLRIVTLGKNKLQYIQSVKAWQQDGTGCWLAWTKDDSTKPILKNLLTGQELSLPHMQELMFDVTGQWLIGKGGENGGVLYLHHLSDGRLLHYDDVVSYSLHRDGRVILLLYRTAEGTRLLMEDLSSGKRTIIFMTTINEEVVGYTMDNSGRSFAVVTRNKDDSHCVYWYYRKGARAVKLVEDRSTGLSSNLRLGSWVAFTDDARYLQFYLEKEPDMRMPSGNVVMVDIWSHSDELFYTAQSQTNRPTYYPAVISVSDGKAVQLGDKTYEQLEGEAAGDYAIVSKRQTGDRFWEYRRDSVWLVNLREGIKKLLPCIQCGWVELDKKGAKVNYFDRYRGRHYYQYDVATGSEQRLSASVPDGWLGIENPFFTGWEEREKMVKHVIAARLREQSSLLVYDSYDIWRIDLTGKRAALNITNGYGRKNKIVFRITMPEEQLITLDGDLLLTGFNELSKENGFYRKQITLAGDPDSLFMGPYFFSHDRKILKNLDPSPYGVGMLPVKAASANAWIVKRESATEAPNYFFTSDFKSFKPLTNLQPQKGYNWYTTELVNFMQVDSLANQGVLYKPLNFDPQKKYPVLFYHYEQYSYGLNRFISPAVSEAGKPNIPWYVSRGYLVFTPDNYFQKGWVTRSGWYSVEGAARCLSRRPYIDSLHMGVIGLSMAGGLTYYIITRTNLFAAAFVGCGVANNVSGALQWAQLEGIGGSRLGVESRMGSNMWDSPEQWVDESPVLKANKITTPLLIMHNKKDGAVLFEQAVEMFTAMRRLNKKVWLLQYDRGGHGVGDEEALDLTTRMTQFFDHYLKGALAPRWMVQGIPANRKGIEKGLELTDGIP